MSSYEVDTAYVHAVQAARAARVARTLSAAAYKSARNAIDRADAMHTDGLISERVAIDRMHAAIREARALCA